MTMPAPADELAARCAAIELLVVDVDGVLTDGVIALDDRGVETKHFHVRDGGALALWQRSGRRVAILSGRRSEAVDRRAAELGIPAASVIQGASEKGGPFRALVASLGVDPSRACYVGDDLPDLAALAAAGLAACPADAAAEVRDAAHLVASSPGGRGAVREIVEVILKQQGAWGPLVARLRGPA
jgi:3-deoxy-D-manno-octulosonate 8-phosphate phosphatase (KDO 8-P phosphatase)